MKKTSFAPLLQKSATREANPRKKHEFALFSRVKRKKDSEPAKKTYFFRFAGHIFTGSEPAKKTIYLRYMSASRVKTLSVSGGVPLSCVKLRTTTNGTTPSRD